MGKSVKGFCCCCCLGKLFYTLVWNVCLSLLTTFININRLPSIFPTFFSDINNYNITTTIFNIWLSKCHEQISFWRTNPYSRKHILHSTHSLCAHRTALTAVSQINSEEVFGLRKIRRCCRTQHIFCCCSGYCVLKAI